MLINCLASPILKFIHHGSKLHANALCVMRIYEVFGKSFHIDCIFGTSDILCRLSSILLSFSDSMVILRIYSNDVF